jgi:hypothetical protein
LCHSATAVVARVFHDIDGSTIAEYFLNRFFDRFRAGLKDPEQGE